MSSLLVAVGSFVSVAVVVAAVVAVAVVPVVPVVATAIVPVVAVVPVVSGRDMTTRIALVLFSGMTEKVGLVD